MTDVKITTEREYFAASKRVFELMVDDPAANTPEGEELARLTAAIDEFEGGHDPLSCCVFSSEDTAARIIGLFRDLIGIYDLAGAIDWCETPQQLLDGRKPIEMLISKEGAAEVDAVVARLRDGVHV